MGLYFSLSLIFCRLSLWSDKNIFKINNNSNKILSGINAWDNVFNADTYLIEWKSYCQTTTNNRENYLEGLLERFFTSFDSRFFAKWQQHLNTFKHVFIDGKKCIDCNLGRLIHSHIGKTILIRNR